MTTCSRYCLYSSLRIVNVVVNLFGVGMIIYSLWLLKEWEAGVSVLPSACDLIRPWFIYVCLAVGIVVCFSTLSGHMVANCINKSILAVEIITYIDEDYKSFKSFILFHLVVCRSIAILVLVAQINIVVLAAILWALGGETTTHSHISCPVDIRQSFLADFNSPGLDDQRGLEGIMKSYMEGIFTRSFRQIR